MALLTQADLEVALQRDFTNGADPTIAALLAQVESFIASVAGRPLESAAYTHEVDGNGEKYLWLGRWPVTAVATVTVDGSAWVEGTDFKWRSDGRLVALAGCWPLGDQNIEVSYTAGYVSAPPGYVTVAMAIAKRLYKDGATSAAAPDGVVQETIGSYSATYQWQGSVSEADLTQGESRLIGAMPWAKRRHGSMVLR